MALYKCSVIDEKGKKRKISRKADSRQEIINYIKEKNYIIIHIKESANKIDKDFDLKTMQKIKAKDISIFCKQLYAMLKAGVTIVNSLEILRFQTENKKLQKIIAIMYEDLQKGNTFSEALSNHKYAFPEMFISMVEAGEISGSIDVIMNRLAIHYEKEYKIENKVKTAMTYPIILAVVAISVVIFLLTTVMPTFVDMYASSGVPLPMITRMMISISDVLKTRWYLVLSLLLLLSAILPIVVKNEKVKYKIDYMKLQMPVYKNLSLKIATSRFTRTLSTLMGSGVPLLQALDTVSGVTGNTYIGKKILEAKEEVRRGFSLSQPLKNQGVFPPMVHSMIKIGEDSGSIEEILDKTADFYDEEVETAIQRATALLEPAMIVVMAVVIGIIVLAMVLPMFDMVSTV